MVIDITERGIDEVVIENLHSSSLLVCNRAREASGT